MKRTTPIALAAALTAATALPVYASGHGRAATSVTSTESTDSTYTTPNSAEAATLQYMREEEKLARDVYTHLYSSWGEGVFENISEAEQQHTDQVAAMLDKYRIPDPVTPDVPGLFVNPTLQQLYTDLVTQGDTSLLAALRVGALIEETDMLDLARAIDETDQADIATLYSDLMQGSRNHLRAFVSRIEELGVTYTAQVLSQEEVDAIVDSPVERGHR